MRVAERTVQRPENLGHGFSRLFGAAFLTLFLIGIGEGAIAYAHRSPVTERHGPGTNAITIHVLLAVAVAAVVVGVQVRRSRGPGKRGPSPWAVPFSANAVARLGQTFRFACGPSGWNVARVLAAVPLLLVLAYAPYRMGAQVTGGLDPNSTVNAWGGPSYAGALLAHWMDGAIGFYVAAFLLSRLLLPPRGAFPGRPPVARPGDKRIAAGYTNGSASCRAGPANWQDGSS